LAATSPENHTDVAALFRHFGCLYVARGWPVLPLHGKRPVWDDWVNQATLDPGEVALLWDEPRYGLGVVTGCRSGLLVLDVDPRNGGNESLAAVRDRLPDTATVRTGSGGLHFYYRTQADVKSWEPLPGLELKARGRQVVAPPSLHPNTGERYAWVNGLPLHHELAEWPGGLLAKPAREGVVRVAGSPGEVLAPAARLVAQVRHAENGQRNNVLFRVACCLTRDYFAGVVDERVLGHLFDAALFSGLDEDEVKNVLASAEKKVREEIA
jgi:hypothetical protein